MIKQQYPPCHMDQIQNILTQLNLKSIDELILSDNINIQFLAKTTNLHKSVVLKLLFQLQVLVNKPEELAPSQKYSLSFKEIVKQWNRMDNSTSNTLLEKINDIQMGSSEIVEIIGRANSGKSYFCFAFILHCLRKDITVIFIDSNENYQMLLQYIRNKVNPNNTEQQQYTKLISKIISFKFRTLSQFSILLHNLGNQLTLQRKRKNSLIEKGVVTVIDCLSRIQMADPDTDEQNSTMDFDIIQRLKRLLITYSTRVCSIVYTNRIPTAYTLFHTFYKNQKHRPRCKNNNSKLWDSIAGKTIAVDYTRNMNNEQIKKIHFTKDLMNQVLTFQK